MNYYSKKYFSKPFNQAPIHPFAKKIWKRVIKLDLSKKAFEKDKKEHFRMIK